MASEQSAHDSTRAQDAYAILKGLLCRLRESDPDRFAFRLKKRLELFLDGNQDASWPLDHLVHLLSWVIELPESSSKKKQYFPSDEIVPSILAENPAMWLSRAKLREISETLELSITKRTQDRLFYEVGEKLTNPPDDFRNFDRVYDVWQKEQRAREQAGEPSMFVDSDEDHNRKAEERASGPQLIEDTGDEQPLAGAQASPTSSRNASQSRSDASSTPAAPNRPSLVDEQKRVLAARKRKERNQVRQEKRQAHVPFMNVMNPCTPKRKRARVEDEDADAADDSESDKEESPKKQRPFPSMLRSMTAADRNKMQETENEQLRRKITTLEKEVKMAVKFRNRLEKDILEEKERTEEKKRELVLVQDQLSYLNDENARLREVKESLERELAAYRQQARAAERSFW